MAWQLQFNGKTQLTMQVGDQRAGLFRAMLLHGEMEPHGCTSYSADLKNADEMLCLLTPSVVVGSISLKGSD